LTAEEIAEMAPPTGRTSEFDVTPSLRVVQNEYTQAWEIEARNIELPELIEQLAHYCPHPIVCGQDVRGTVSAKVSAYSIDEALHRLVAPFGFKIGRSDVGIVVGAPYQPSADVHADYETTTVDTAQSMPAELDRLPPVPHSGTVAEAPAETPTEATSVQPVSLIDKSTKLVVDESELNVAHMAKQMISRGDSAEAIHVIAAAVSEKPNSAFLFRILGEALAFQSEYEGAAAALERSIKLNKYDPLTSQVFSEVLSRLGQDRRAEHYAQLSRDIVSGTVTAP
jgi:tetratricopeptide (TPR) repeat protein